MHELTLAVDIGTTQTKTVAFDSANQVVATRYMRYPLQQKELKEAVQDPQKILQAVVQTIQQVVQAVDASAITKLTFSSAMHSLMALDVHEKPLTPLLTWADNRAIDYVQQIKQTTLGHELYAQTGVPTHPMAPFFKLLWLQEQAPEIFNQAAKFIGIKEYILLQLFDVCWIDKSSASGMGLLNVYTQEWEELALNHAQISTKQLPRLVTSRKKLPPLSADWQQKLGLSAKVQAYVGGADGPLANLGVGAVSDHCAALSIGTSAAIRVVTSQPYLHPEGKTFCYVLDEQRWVVGGATSNGATLVDWARQNFLTEFDKKANTYAPCSYQRFFTQIADVPAGAQGLLFYPYLLGERAPIWQAQASGTFMGLMNYHHDTAMARAVMEGLGFNIKQILTDVEATGLKIKQLRGAGGFAQSSFLVQLMADILGLPLAFVQTMEASALGAALLTEGMAGKNMSERMSISVVKTIEPQPATQELYQKIYRTYRTLLPNVVNCFDELNKLKEAIN